MTKEITIGVIAGEVSGDNLGKGLLRELKIRYPSAHFVGIGGPGMIEEGLESLYPMECLSVMGLEVLRKLFSILSIRRRIPKQLLDRKIDLFIGIDAPDFNLTVERKLRDAGIKTVHYVSPSVWAWRQWRIHKIKKAADLMLCFLPFEKAFYDKHDMPCVFTGHFLADQIEFGADPAPMRAELGLSDIASGEKVIAVLPGSRSGEIKTLTPVFLGALRILKDKGIKLRAVVPIVNEKRKAEFLPILEELGADLDVTVVDGRARDVMRASDLVMLSSGTATLEAMLVGRPMVVAYKISKFSEFIARRLIKIDCVSLPNLLLGRHAVPELLQDDCTSEKVASETERLLGEDARSLIEEFGNKRNELRRGADSAAADAVASLLDR